MIDEKYRVSSIELNRPFAIVDDDMNIYTQKEVCALINKLYNEFENHKMTITRYMSENVKLENRNKKLVKKNQKLYDAIDEILSR